MTSQAVDLCRVNVSPPSAALGGDEIPVFLIFDMVVNN